MLEAIVSHDEIMQCQRLFENALKDLLPNQMLLRPNVKFTPEDGKPYENPVYYYDREGLWYSTRPEAEPKGPVPRFWNGFGIGIRPGLKQNIDAEINVRHYGYYGGIAGLFANDESSGNVYVLHSGDLRGGRPGVGKKALISWLQENREDWYRENLVEVKVPNRRNTHQRFRVTLLISNETLNDEILKDIRKYVAMARDFKQAVKQAATAPA
ncbi:MAG TPA: hypothetical protein VN285_07920 [Candidatus Deferrimicrobium sp.]|nr:hypothetical protein [Candidatus Deferrimicrobium sp.]